MAANLEKVWEYGTYGGYTLEPVRLADVLLAIEANVKDGHTQVISSTGHFGDWNGIDSGAHYPSVMWNFRKDDLTEQSDKTLAFLASLLTKEDTR